MNGIRLHGDERQLCPDLKVKVTETATDKTGNGKPEMDKLKVQNTEHNNYSLFIIDIINH